MLAMPTGEPDLTVVEVERRMRPGAWSRVGFLGPEERLEDVLAADTRTLERLGLSRTDLTVPLGLLIRSTHLTRSTLLTDRWPTLAVDPALAGMRASSAKLRDEIERRFGRWKRGSPQRSSAAASRSVRPSR
jgi:hypothetical protein